MNRRQVKSWEGASAAELKKRWRRDAVYLYGKVDSTNEAARDLAAAGAPAGTIVLAREQAAGRGREGRPWASPARAGLYMSMVFRMEETPVPPLVGVLAGADVARALSAGFAGLDVSVKWPNDLMADDRKLGGILAETSATADDTAALVVGVGINVRGSLLPDALVGAAALDELVGAVELASVADAVVRGLERRLPQGPAALEEADLDELDRLDWLKNKRVRHRLGEGDPVSGIAAGIAPDGALLLRPDRGALRRVVAGSIEVTQD